jgi:hypothetical protein
VAARSLPLPNSLDYFCYPLAEARTENVERFHHRDSEVKRSEVHGVDINIHIHIHIHIHVDIDIAVDAAIDVDVTKNGRESSHH